MLAVVYVRERASSSGLGDVAFRLEAPRIRSLLRLGLPAALQIALEVGVFAAATALAFALERPARGVPRAAFFAGAAVTVATGAVGAVSLTVTLRGTVERHGPNLQLVAPTRAVPREARMCPLRLTEH